MTKRKWTWILVSLCLLVGAVGVYWNFFAEQSITISQQDLQSKINAKMPHQAKHGVVVNDATVILHEGSLELTVSAAVQKFGKNYSAQASGKGNLVYDHASGAFYFQPEKLTLKDVQVNGSSVGGKVGGFVDKWVQSSDSESKQALVKAAEAGTEKLIQRGAETVFAITPVYKLPDNFKGTAVKMFLSSVEMKEGAVVAHLSLWQFTVSVMLFGLALLAAIGMTVALFANPEWGMVVIAFSSWT